MTTALQIATWCAKALDGKKGQDLKVIGIRDISILADYFVIATGTSTTHVRALADEVEFQLRQRDIAPKNIEGHNGNNWVLLDYGNVIVHVFSNETRSFYDLERLWRDGEQIDVNQLIEGEQDENGRQEP